MSLDTELLRQLRGRGADPVSPSDLAARLGTSVSELRAHVSALRALGYDIEDGPLSGFRLRMSPDLLHAEDIGSRLGPVRVVGRDVRVFHETTSTSDVVGRLAGDGVAEGVVVFAESQTRGRGRLGRHWSSPARLGLWMSALLRPALRPVEVTRVTIAAAVGLSRVLEEEAGLRPEIKWPNDVLVRGRKIAGILTEMAGELDSVRHVTLGIGVNVNQGAGDFPPELRDASTSVRLESGELADRAELAAALLTALDADYDRITHGGFGDVANEWERRCSTIGKEVAVRLGERVVQGRAESLDEDGALLVRNRHGRIERVTGGDLTVAGPEPDSTRTELR